MFVHTINENTYRVYLLRGSNALSGSCVQTACLLTDCEDTSTKRRGPNMPGGHQEDVVQGFFVFLTFFLF